MKIAQLGIFEVVYSQGYNMDKDVSELAGLLKQCADNFLDSNCVERCRSSIATIFPGMILVF